MSDGSSPPEQRDLSTLFGTLAPGQFYRRDGARLNGDVDPSMLGESPATPAHHRAYHAFDKAHLVMLLETGLIPRSAGVAMLLELRRMEEQDDHVALRDELGYGPHAGEAHLIDVLGEEVGGWLHLGRSSRDLRAVATRLVVRDRLLELAEACLRACERYVDVAHDHTDAVVPSYTWMQHAQVSTIAHQLLSWERPLERGLQRLQECYRRVNVSPAGTVAGTGTDFPIDRVRTADLLGFEGVADNAADATCNGDVDLEVMHLLALILEPIDTAIQRLVVWHTSEFGYVSIADEYSGTSSVMPQKTNPVGLHTILAAVDRTIGSVATAMTSGRRLDGRCRIDVTAVEDCIRTVETFETVLSSATFDRDRAREGVYAERALATDLAGLLVREASIPWRSAHQICAILCRRLADAGESLADLDAARVTDVASEYLGEEIDLSDDAVAAVLDANRAVESRQSVPGSPAPEQVHSQLEATDRRLAETREWLDAERSRIEAADQALSEAVDTLTAGDP